MRLDTVAVGIDFSRAGLAAATSVQCFAPQAAIALVHAIEQPARPHFPSEDRAVSQALESNALASAMDELRQVAEGLGTKVTRIEVRIGRAADVINQFAIDAAADLIVVGPHGDRRHRSPFLGTTADTLVRAATIPVLVSERRAFRGRSRVIAAVTEGASRERVSCWAEMLARQLGGRLTIIHAIEPAAYSHMASLVAAQAHGDETAERLEIAATLEREARHWVDECVRTGVDASRIDADVEEGVASDVILQHAAEQRAAVIVLGRHEGRPLGLARLGRTVRHVLHSAKCAVLVVPSE